MALDPRILLGGEPVKINDLMDTAVKAQSLRDSQSRNMLVNRHIQQLDSADSRANKLSQITRDSYNAQSGAMDNAKLKQGLYQAGMMDEVKDVDKGELEARQQLRLETTQKINNGIAAFDYAVRRIGDATPETWEQTAKDIQKEIGMELPVLNVPWRDGLKEDLIQQTLTGKEKLNLEQKKLDSQFKQTEFEYRREKDEKDRAVTLSGQDDKGWIQTVGADGLPVWTQHRQEGTPAYSSTGISNKVLPTGQSKQVIGTKNLGDAVDEYVNQLDGFDMGSLVSPDARAGMGTKYNNMMLQAKEAYNLGVLNGGDLKILTDTVTNPASWTGAVTSNKALKLQATELKRIMQKVGETAGKNYSERSMKNPPQETQGIDMSGWSESKKAAYNAQFGGQ